MDVATITELVANLGLPIVLIGFMGYFIYRLWQQSAKRETKLYEELSACRAVNEKAITTIAQYADKLDVIQEDVKTIKENMVIVTERLES